MISTKNNLIKEQTKQDRSIPQHNGKDNPCTNKAKLETEYFVAGTDTETYRAAVTKRMGKMGSVISSQALGA